MLPTPLNLAQAPTPLHRLDRISARWGQDIWIKRDDLTGSGLTGNKVRKLEYLLADALQYRADTVITCGGIQSNHCRSTALAAARVGLRCELLLRGDVPDQRDGNLLLDGIAGAKVHFISAEDYYADLTGRLERIAAGARSNGGRPYIITEGGSDPIGAWGYVEALREVRTQCERAGVEPQRIIVATGSGGTHAGLFVGTRLEGWDVEIISVSVCYDAAETARRIFAIVEAMKEKHEISFRAQVSDIHVWDGFIGPGYGKAGNEEFKVIIEMARSEGILVDPVYTGKAARGLKEMAATGELHGTSILWHTGGVFGIFPFREGLGRLI